MLILLTSSVSGNSPDLGDIVEFGFDYAFDNIPMVDGLRRLGDTFKHIPDQLPNFKEIGQIYAHVLGLFPPRYWYALCIVLICLAVGRIVKRT